MKIGEGEKRKSGEMSEASELPLMVGQSEERAGRHDELLQAGKFKLESLRCERLNVAEESFLAPARL